jgi:hypothetical protein
MLQGCKLPGGLARWKSEVLGCGGCMVQVVVVLMVMTDVVVKNTELESDEEEMCGVLSRVAS